MYDNLPRSLTKLYCYYNPALTHLPGNLPHSLTYLNCSSNPTLTHLPDNLHHSLTVLCCFSNPALTHMPFELHTSNVVVIFDNKMDLYKNNAAMRIHKWYKMRQAINRTVCYSKLYEIIMLPSDISKHIAHNYC